MSATYVHPEPRKSSQLEVFQYSMPSSNNSQKALISTNEQLAKGKGSSMAPDESLDRKAFEQQLKNRGMLSPKQSENRDYMPTSKSDMGGKVVVTSKYDQHFKQSNLHYVMRRTTHKAQQNQNQYENYRTSTTQVAQGGFKFVANQNQRASSFVGGATSGPGGDYRALSMKTPAGYQIPSPKSEAKSFGMQGLQSPKYMPPPLQVQDQAIQEDQQEYRVSLIQETTPENSLSIAMQNPIGINQFLGEVPQFQKPISQEIRFNIEGLIEAIEKNDARIFRQVTFNMTNQEIADIRILDEELNLLQAICFYNSEMLIEIIKDRFKGDKEGSKSLVEYEEPDGGNRALNFAVLSGNQKLIDFILNDLKANAKFLTTGRINLLHQAAQIDRGALSLMNFTQRQFGLNVNQKDQFGCTPLHFAVNCAQFKCVECLLALGADPNIQNEEGQTPLHIAVQKYIEMNRERKARKQQAMEAEERQALEEDDRLLYEDLKRIMKELLFNGAKRETMGSFELSSSATHADREVSSSQSTVRRVTPYQLLYHVVEDLPPREFRSLRVVLDVQKGAQCLTMHRPLRKVEKSSNLMMSTTGFNILFFVIFAIFQYHFYYREGGNLKNHKAYESWALSADAFFILTAISYFLTCFIEPGFVFADFGIIDILRLANEKSIDLENFCFYCKIIKSGKTFHCNYCKHCVEKFDHHCTFVNNCIGHQNHKYFLGFIFFYLLYFVTSLVASILSLSTHDHDKKEDLLNEDLDIFFRVIFIGFQLTQFVPLSYQMREQTRKLFKKTEKFKEVRRHRGYNQIMMSSGRSTFGGEHGGIPRNNTANVSFFEIVESKAGFCYNLKQIFRYEKPSQEELRAFLFSDSERFSTFHLKYSKRKEQGLIDSNGNVIFSNHPDVGSPNKEREPLLLLNEDLRVSISTQQIGINKSDAPVDSFVTQN